MKSFVDKHDIENRVKQFVKDPDPEVELNLDGDLRKIAFAFRHLKKLINLGGSLDNLVLPNVNQGIHTNWKIQSSSRLILS